MSETISIGTSGGLPRPRELRLAVAMRGGVSLAVWMGGACQEIEALRRSARSQPGQAASKVYRALLDRADYNKVVVDVLAGTSAGGLNAVLLSCALLYDMPFDAHVRDLWLRVADILRLCRPADDRDPQSLLQGDAVFYQDLMGNLRTLLKDKLVPRQSEHEQDRLEQVRRSRVDLILTCTLLQPAPEDFHQPIGDPITDARSRAYFRFRNLEQGEVSDFDPSDEGTGARGDPWEPVRRLAYAGRSTSSYPGAFEPATIWAAPGDDRSEAPGGGEPHPRNMHGVFSESMARRPTAGEAVPAHVIDGGVLDNIPIAWAIRSIAAARANRPVDRWLLYLQPVPPSAPLPLKPDPKDRGRLLRLVPVTVKAHSIKLGSESLLEDVDELRRYATAAGQRRRVADALATTPLDLDGLLSKASAALENQAAGGYRTRQAAVEASRLARLLEAPVEVTGPDPLPFGGVRDPLDQMSNDVAADLLAQLAAPPDQELEELVLPDGVTGADLDQLHRRLRNLQAVGRAVATLLDCARDLERQGEEVPSATGGGDVRAGDVAQNELFPLRFAVEMVVAAHDRLVLRRCAQIGEGASPSPDAIVRDAAAALRQAAEAAEVTTEPTNVEKLKNLSERVTRDDPLPRAVAWPEDGYGWLWEPLAKVAERLARAIPKNGPAYAYLRDAADRQPPVVLQALLATEVLFGPLRPDPLSENASIRFHMISAANQSPLNMSIFNTAAPTTNQKLAGNQLNNFGAFLSARWRQNDWTWGRLDAATSLVRLLTRPERVSKESLQALVADLGLDPGDRDREELVDQVLGLLHEQILSDELPVMAGLRDEPPTGTPTPAPQADRKLLATVGAESVQNLPEARRRQVIGRISRLLWRSLKDVPRGRARIWRGAITVTEPIGAALVRFGLRRFVK